MIDRAINAGIDNINGMALQRNTAIFLLLDNYLDKFQNKKYFVCLEHHDDFLFCFLNENDEVDQIEAYQSKKKLNDIWRLNSDFFEIINKLLKTGKELLKDDISKSKDYEHLLFFSSNQTINLNQDSDNISINVGNELVEYNYLPNSIQNKIKNKITDTTLLDELNKLNFMWISLSPKVNEQKNHLVGKLGEVFGNKIIDKESAIETLIFLFFNIESVYNQGNIVKLLDRTKRVDSCEIDKTFNVLTSKSKCFDYWHNRETEVSIALMIKPYERERFKMIFSSAFDLFKSLQEAQHRKILNFVHEQYQNVSTLTHEDNVSELFNLYKSNHTTDFAEMQLKAILFAALFQVLYLKEI